jgi:hypothetical protein
MNLPKHQHWVSYFYLRYFSTPETRAKEDPQAWIFSKNESDGDETLTNIRNICGKRYLYTPFDEDGKRNWNLERKLDGLETTMGVIWPDLANGFVDLSNSSLRKGISLFVSVMHLRNPAIRSFIEQLHNRLIKAYEELPLRPDGYPDISSIEVKGTSRTFDMSDWHNYRAVSKNDHDRFFVRSIETEAKRIANHLMKKRWSIVFSEREIFITSDKPVLLEHQSKETFGFGTEGTIVMFPLSPRRLLVMDDMHEEPANQYYPLLQENEGSFNYGIWHNGSRFMITGRPVPEVLRDILAWTDGPTKLI